MNRSYVGLGSNIEFPQSQLLQALARLTTLDDCRLVSVSSVWCSPPIGPPEQPDYFNAAIALDTSLTPVDLLKALQDVENKMGRVRTLRWGPRCIDLDLLLYSNRVMATELLTLPHPGLTERPFVLLPLYEIAPDLILPDQRPIRTLLEEHQSSNIRKV